MPPESINFGVEGVFGLDQFFGRWTRKHFFGDALGPTVRKTGAFQMPLKTIGASFDNLLQAFLFSRSFAGRKIGRDQTSRAIQELVSFTSLFCSSLGLNKPTSAKLEKVVSGYLRSSISHEHATIEVQLLSDEVSCQAKSRELFALGNLLAAFGLFVASQEIEREALGALRRSLPVAQTSSKRLEIRRLQSAILGSDLEAVRSLTSPLRALLRHEAREKESIRALLEYAHAISGSAQGLPVTKEPTTELDGRWRKTLANKRFLVIGPGEVSRDEFHLDSFDYVVRIAGAGVLDWTVPNDFASGRCDIVYLNPENRETLVNSDAKYPGALSSTQWICFKRLAPSLRPNINTRSVETGSLLFLRGHANLIPLICVDLARLPGTSIHVVGANFFASKNAYRPASLRIGPSGKPATQAGSTGPSYDRSTIMASHNTFQNLTIVRNLSMSGRVTGDQLFQDICALPEAEYAKRLDLLYGRYRV